MIHNKCKKCRKSIIPGWKYCQVCDRSVKKKKILRNADKGIILMRPMNEVEKAMDVINNYQKFLQHLNSLPWYRAHHNELIEFVNSLDTVGKDKD